MTTPARDDHAGDASNEKREPTRWFWVSLRNDPARDNTPAPAVAEEVLVGPRPFGYWPRWWSVTRADGSQLEVLDEDIIGVPMFEGVTLPEAINRRLDELGSMKVVNVIAAKYKVRNEYQLRRVEQVLDETYDLHGPG